MDSSISETLQLPLLLTTLLFFSILLSYLKQSRGQSKVPPGPKPLPIIGNLHQMTGGLPHLVLSRLSQKYGPVMKLQLGQVPAVVISSPEATKAVLKTHDINFSQRPRVYATEITSSEGSSMVTAPHAEYWRQVKKIVVTEIFSTQRIQSFRSIREEEVWNLIELISSFEGQTLNLSEKIFGMHSDIISRVAFGSKREDKMEFMAALDKLISLAGSFAFTDAYPSLTFLCSLTGAKSKILSIRKQMDTILEEIVTKHKLKRNTTTNSMGSEDIVDTLLNHTEAGNSEFHINTDQVKAIVLDLLGGGSEILSTAIEWAMAELLKNPKVMKKAQEKVRRAYKGRSKIEEADIQNLKYLNLLIKETFRLHPPFTIIPRLAAEGCEINGYTIPANTKILINPYAIGRDPTIWTNPECFQPERFEGTFIDFKGHDFELLPFGAGRRMCVGMLFAITNIEFALSQLIYHFDWKLASGIKLKDIDMTENFGLVTRLKNNLNVFATTRIPFHK